MSRWPAEHEPADALVVAWPDERTDWAPWLSEVHAALAQFVELVSAAGAVVVLARDAERARAELASALDGVPPAVRFEQVEFDDTWARDYGPFVVFEDDRAVVVDFRFNGWGGRYESARDDAVVRVLHARGFFGDAPLVQVPWVLEGGAIEGNGSGVALTNAPSVVDPRRNPAGSRNVVREMVTSLLGLDDLVFVDHVSLLGDDTDGHIDLFARFAPGGTLLFAQSPGARDPRHPGLALLEPQLEVLAETRALAARLVPVPMPRRLLAGRRRAVLPATYLNFVAFNGLVVVPTVGDDADDEALSRIAEAFAGWRVVGFDARVFLEEGGALHCLSCVLPKGVLA